MRREDTIRNFTHGKPNESICSYRPFAFPEHGAILSAIRLLMHPAVPPHRPIGFTVDLQTKK